VGGCDCTRHPFVITGLDPVVCFRIVIPAKAGIQLHVERPKLDPDFRWGDEKQSIG
jgi:hypothetical protein